MYNGMYFLCIDNSRFLNHSEENCNTYDAPKEQSTYASKDINIGEEILSNYKFFGITEEDYEFNTKEDFIKK